MLDASPPPTPAPAAPGDPVSLAIVRPERQSRLTNFPLGVGYFIRVVLLIPHLFILYFFSIVAALLYFIATFAILFSGVYPRGMFDLVAGYVRWNARVSSYLYSLFDQYPPFSSDPGGDYPLTLQIDYPERSSRLLNFPVFGLLIRAVLIIPHSIVLLFVGIAAFVVIFVAQFAILFTGAFPEGMHRFVTGYSRWSTRITAYGFGLTDRYPPFSLS